MAAGIVLEQAGLHQATVTLPWQPNTSGARNLIVSAERIVDGVTVVLKERRVTQPPTEGGVAWQQIVFNHIAEPGDQIVVRVRQTTGADLDVLADDTTIDVSRLAQ